MMKLARACLVTLNLLAAGIHTPIAHAGADSSVLTTISQRMKPAQVLRGQFTQEKTFSIMTRPLKSSGNFVLDKNRGIWWHNITPIPGDMVLSDAGIVQVTTNGQRQKLASAQQPALKLMTDIIRQLVGGDWEKLQNHFDIEANTAPSAWTATLTPKAGSLFANHAARIEVIGNTYVEQITLQEKSTDKTHIVFSQLSSDSQLQPSEADAFAW